MTPNNLLLVGTVLVLLGGVTAAGQWLRSRQSPQLEGAAKLER